jgi:hypothetical protein
MMASACYYPAIPYILHSEPDSCTDWLLAALDGQARHSIIHHLACTLLYRRCIVAALPSCRLAVRRLFFSVFFWF